MTDQLLMQEAVAQAQAALAMDEVPIGCVVLHRPSGKIIAGAHNRRETRADPTAHAEILALREAAAALGHWRLNDCTLAVTLEPCPMCAAAIGFARLRRLYFAAYDEKGGGVEHGPRIFEQPTCHHRPEIYGGIGEARAARLLRRFFSARR